MRLLVSSNERPAVQAAIRAAVPDAEARALVDGDVAILDDQGGAVCLVERKTWSDLRGSLGNNHLRDQLARMRAACTTNVLIVEAAVVPAFEAGAHAGISDKFAHAFLADAQRDGVLVLWAATSADLGRVCAWLLKRAREGRLAPAAADGAAAACGPADPIARTARARNADATAVRAAMLACIPGISLKKAGDLTAHVDLRLALPPKSPVKGIGPVLWKRIRDVLSKPPGFA